MIKRPLPVIGCAYLLSLAVVFLLTTFSWAAGRPAVFTLIAAVAPAAVCIICALVRPGKNILRVVLIAAVAFSMGILHAHYQTVTIPVRASALYESKAIIQARVDDTAGVSGSKTHYIISTSRIAVYNPQTERYDITNVPQAVRMRLTVPAPLDATYGDTIQTVVTITAPYPVANDSPYVIRDARGVLAFAYAYDDIAYESPKHYTPLALLRALRDRVTTAIERAVGSDAGRVAAAILTGDKGGVSAEILTAFRVTGLSHLLAVSGLHATILTQFFLLLLTLLRCPRKASAIICMAALLLFAAFTGFTASVVRAVIMASALFAAHLFDRRYDAVNSITLAALIICAITPAALLSLGFLLSFAATLAIVLLAPALDALCKRWLPWLFAHARWAVQGVTLSLSATLFTYPITASVFGEISVIGPVVNVLVIPFVPALTVLTLLTGVAGVAGVGWVTAVLGFCTRVVMLIVLRIATLFAALDFASVRVGVLAACLTAALSVLCAAAVRMVKRQKRHTAALLCLGVLLMGMGLSLAGVRPSTDIIIAFPDSARTQTAVVHRAGRAVVIAGTDTKSRASGAAYYISDHALTADLLLVPCLTDAAAAVVRETTTRSTVSSTLIAGDTLRARELLELTDHARLLTTGGVTAHTPVDGVVCYVDKQQQEKAAVLLTANGSSVLFLYQGTDCARLPSQFLSPDVCVVSGRMPVNFNRIDAGYYILREDLAQKYSADLSGKTVLSALDDNPLRLHCAQGGELRLEDTAIDVYR